MYTITIHDFEMVTLYSLSDGNFNFWKSVGNQLSKSWIHIRILLFKFFSAIIGVAISNQRWSTTGAGVEPESKFCQKTGVGAFGFHNFPTGIKQELEFNIFAETEAEFAAGVKLFGVGVEQESKN